VEGCCEDGNEPSDYIKYWEILDGCATGGFSRKAQLPGVSYNITFHFFLYLVLFNAKNLCITDISKIGMLY
jgi:hypothetical protein